MIQAFYRLKEKENKIIQKHEHNIKENHLVKIEMK
jgi:hypothetical protein